MSLHSVFIDLHCRSYVLREVLKIWQGFVQSNDNSMLGQGYGDIHMQLSRVYMNLQKTE